MLLLTIIHMLLLTIIHIIIINYYSYVIIDYHSFFIINYYSCFIIKYYSCMFYQQLLARVIPWKRDFIKTLAYGQENLVDEVSTIINYHIFILIFY